MLTIVDYGVGNLGSIVNMLTKLGHSARLGSRPQDLLDADGLILPGVGAFDNGMRKLADSGLVDVLSEQVREKRIPVLGICLGAQLMLRGSEEGSLSGLGWVDAESVRFFGGQPNALKIPAMGWLDVRPTRSHWLLNDLPAEPRYYFVHAYHFRMSRPEDTILSATYGYEYPAAFAVENVIGVQFHPEKSHRFGMRLLDAFASHVRGAVATSR